MMDELMWIMLDLLFAHGYEVSDPYPYKADHWNEDCFVISAFKPAPPNKRRIKGRSTFISVTGLTTRIKRTIVFKEGGPYIGPENGTEIELNLDLNNPESLESLEKLMR